MENRLFNGGSPEKRVSEENLYEALFFHRKLANLLSLKTFFFLVPREVPLF